MQRAPVFVFIGFLVTAASCGDGEVPDPALVPAAPAADGGAEVHVDAGSVPTEAAADEASPACVNACPGEGRGCDPAGSNQIGTCTKDPQTGCYVVSALAACPAGASVCVPGTAACVMAGYVVAPNGSDSNAGTVAAPFATIAHARDAVRTLNAAGPMTGDVAIYLRAGDYALATSDCNYGGPGTPSPAGLCLDERDSGTGGFKVRYQAYDGVGSARLLGAKPVTGWQLSSGNVFRAPWTGAAFNDLYENGVRAVKARSPNVNADYGVSTAAEGPYFESAAFADGLSHTQLVYKTSDLGTPTWNGTDGHVQVQVFSGGTRFNGDTPNFNWTSDLQEVVGLDTASQVITLRSGTSYNLPANSRYFVQGDVSFLDVPGEWALADGYVYYWPKKTPIESQTILAPQVKALIQICPRFQGGEAPLPTQGYLCGHTAQVHDIVISGLTLEATDFVPEYPDRTATTADPDGMISMQSTKAITVEKCHFKNAGQTAVSMTYANEANVVYGNWMEDLGIGAVFVRTLAKLAGQAPTGGHAITNNKVSFVGMHEAGPMGIHVEESGGNSITRNTVAHGPRILMGGFIDAVPPATGNYFGYNDLYSGCEDAADCAPFYFFPVCANSPCSSTDRDLTHMPLKTVEQLHVDTSAWHTSSQLVPARSAPPWAFYLDDGSSNWLLRNVSITNVAQNPINHSVRLYNGGVNITESNVSWSAGFDDTKMDRDNIGLRPDFPEAYVKSGVKWINDDASACHHTGAWLYRNDPPVADNFGGDETYSNVAGDTFECTFSGTEFWWLTSSTNNRGTAYVQFDGDPASPVDLYTPLSVNQRIAFHKKGLAAQSHTVKITVRGDRAPELDYVVIDAIGVK